jgi:hypothetical protein
MFTVRLSNMLAGHIVYANDWKRIETQKISYFVHHKQFHWILQRGTGKLRMVIEDDISRLPAVQPLNAPLFRMFWRFAERLQNQKTPKLKGYSIALLQCWQNLDSGDTQSEKEQKGTQCDYRAVPHSRYRGRGRYRHRNRVFSGKEKQRMSVEANAVKADPDSDSDPDPDVNR